MDSRFGGADEKYNDLKYLNYITIQHDNSEYSQYCHLRFNSSLVKIGDNVKQGQIIASSGNTGFSTQPHLHFFKLTNSKVGWEDLKIKFKDKIAQ